MATELLGRRKNSFLRTAHGDLNTDFTRSKSFGTTNGGSFLFPGADAAEVNPFVFYFFLSKFLIIFLL